MGGDMTYPPLIFLNITGVVTTRRHKNEGDDFCADRVNKILRGSGGVLVITDTWRGEETIPTMRLLLRALGIDDHKLIGFTPILGDESARTTEIMEWLKIHGRTPFPLQNYIVLDDRNLAFFGNKMIWVKDGWDKGGIQDSHVKAALHQIRTLGATT